MQKIPLSVVVMARNEEKNIVDCLESVAGWVEEIVIVDDFSTDHTLEIAERYTDKIFQRKWDMEGVSRNFAYSKAVCRYVLSLDADERVTPGLKDEIIDIFQNGPEFEGYNIPHRNFLGSRWIQYGGWYPNAKLKMFRRDKFRYEEAEYHPRAFLEGKTFTLKGDILHYNYPDFHAAFAKLNHQTDFEALKWAREGRKISLPAVIWKAITRFIKFYIIKKGYKDGFTGLFFSWFAGLYQFSTYCKYWEIRNRVGDRKSDDMPGLPKKMSVS
ncbi:MAG: glycosyltransferase family 2 protein [Candidatus Omnitrophota bacterium]